MIFGDIKHEHEFKFSGGAACPRSVTGETQVDTIPRIICGCLIIDVPVYCSRIVNICDCGAISVICPDEKNCPYKKGE